MRLVSVGSSYGGVELPSAVHSQSSDRIPFVDEEVKGDVQEKLRGDLRYSRHITMVACEFGPDHAHVFVGNCKNYAVPEMVQRLEGRLLAQDKARALG